MALVLNGSGITSANIVNGTIINEDINSSAAIDGTKVSGSFGKVLQVVNATTLTSTTIASNTYASTGLTASITPTSATSKILVLINQATVIYRQYGATQNGYIKILRDSTDLSVYEAAYQDIRTNTFIDISIGGVFSAAYVDSPSTTSATTYSTQAKVSVTVQSGYIKLQSGALPSTITLMEIGA